MSDTSAEGGPMAGAVTKTVVSGPAPAPSPAATTRADPVTLAQSLIDAAGWHAANFSQDGPNPPYLRIGGKLWITLTEYEPCFSSVSRDRGLLRSKVSIAGHLENYAAIMVDPIAFEECYGPEEATDARFPFGAWLTVRRAGFDGLELWGRRQGEVTLPLAPLAIASAIWLRGRRSPD